MATTTTTTPPIKNWGALAQAAYESYCKQQRQVDVWTAFVIPWDALDEGDQVCWLAVVHQLWAEFTQRPAHARALLQADWEEPTP